ncbi:uncharacterized protein ASCRUDRAFT_7950 [Ascoidea rubescens DSM 1968]|uniref:Uncharacterized protein n=1 Tax=Ascoidea rubescens DSM 1968 TaxID=1344418 RepID=A0A1D2VH67_9ASCO|nr:hypothetical protein ASCRUDRAFT_7950 [Ascoidea rubescens DSM 1968]ODV60976.1 hypothetical protein ASCRUDRAFT_7950 [Ascoidea rubescens DSM 1968]
MDVRELSFKEVRDDLNELQLIPSNKLFCDIMPIELINMIFIWLSLNKRWLLTLSNNNSINFCASKALFKNFQLLNCCQNLRCFFENFKDISSFKMLSQLLSASPNKIENTHICVDSIPLIRDKHFENIDMIQELILSNLKSLKNFTICLGFQYEHKREKEIALSINLKKVKVSYCSDINGSNKTDCFYSDWAYHVDMNYQIYDNFIEFNLNGCNLLKFNGSILQSNSETIKKRFWSILDIIDTRVNAIKKCDKLKNLKKLSIKHKY